MRPGSKILSSGFCCGEVSRRSLVRRIVRKVLRNGLHLRYPVGSTSAQSPMHSSRILWRIPVFRTVDGQSEPYTPFADAHHPEGAEVGQTNSPLLIRQELFMTHQD